MTVVLDSSALLAVLLDEPGRDRVLAVLDDAVMSAVNWSEVVVRMGRRQATAAQVAAAAALMAGRILPFGAHEAGIAGQLAEVGRPLGLSLGDRCCLAAGIMRKARVFTSDRVWAQLSLDIPVEVIR